MLGVSRLNSSDYMQSAYTSHRSSGRTNMIYERVKVKYMEKLIMKVQVNDSVCDQY